MQLTNQGSVLKDRYHIAQGVFYLLSTLLFTPEVFLVIVREYWMYVFRPLESEPFPFPPPPLVLVRPGLPRTVPTTELTMRDGKGASLFANFSDRSMEYDNPFHRSMMQVSFGSAFSFAGHFSNLVALILVMIYTRRYPHKQASIGWPMFFSLSLQIINLVLTVFNTDKAQTAFFVYAIVLIVLMNGSTAVIVVGLFELVIKFPTFYAASLFSGQPICMMISSAIHIALISTRLHPKIAGAIYFGTGALLSVSATAVYFIATRTSKYFIYRIQQKPSEAGKGMIRCGNVWRVLWKARWFYAALFFVQGTTYAVHPGFTVLIVPENFRTEKAGMWENLYFLHVVTFFGYSFCSLLGREFAKVVANWNIESLVPKVNTGKLLLGFAALRALMVPLLLFCNAQTRRHLPVYFYDYGYIAILFLFAFSEGILINLTILKIFHFIEDDERREAFILIPFIIPLASTLCTSLNLVLLRLI